MKYTLLFTALSLLFVFDAHAQWVQVGLADTGVGALLVTETQGNPTIWAGTYTGNVSSFVESGGGLHERGSTFSGNIYVHCLIESQNILLAGTQGGIFRSTDQGKTWTVVLDTASGTTPNVMAFAEAGANLFAATDGTGIFESTDSGLNWNAIPEDIYQSTQSAYSIMIIQWTLYVGTDYGIYSTTDDGKRWDSVTTQIPGEAYALSSNGSIFLAGTVGARSGIYRSRNTGVRWDTSGLAGTFVDALEWENQYLFAGSRPNNNNGIKGPSTGVFLSSDSGLTWSNVSQGLGDTNVTSLAISGENLYAGTHNGLWRRSLSQMIGSSAVAFLHSSVGSLAVYPNPVTFSMTIDYTASSLVKATVTIVNGMGTEIARLFSGELTAGLHEFSWIPSNVAAGMYFCQITSNGASEQVPIVLGK